MKIEVSAEHLLKVLKDAIKPAKNCTIPVLGFVKISAQTITSTDLDLTSVLELDARGGEGEFLIPYHKVNEVLKGEKGWVTIEHHEGDPYEVPAPNTPGHSKAVCGCTREWDSNALRNVYSCGHVEKKEGDGPYENPDATATRLGDPWVTVSINGCEYRFEALRVAHFPVAPVFEGDTAHIKREDFKTLLDRTSFAISQEASRYTLNGCLLIVKDGDARMVATDGHRLSLADVHGADGKLTTLIPLDAIEYLQSRISNSVIVTTGKVKADDTSEYIRFDVGTKQLICRKLNGQFPNYEAVMPRTDNLQMHIPDPSVLGKTLARVAKCADDRSGVVRWTLNSSDGATLTAESDNGKARAKLTTVVTETAGDPAEPTTVTMGFNAGYISEFLKIAGDEPVTLHLRNSESAALFSALNDRTGDAWKYVVMPMRI